VTCVASLRVRACVNDKTLARARPAPRVRSHTVPANPRRRRCAIGAIARRNQDERSWPSLLAASPALHRARMYRDPGSVTVGPRPDAGVSGVASPQSSAKLYRVSPAEGIQPRPRLSLKQPARQNCPTGARPVGHGQDSRGFIRLSARGPERPCVAQQLDAKLIETRQSIRKTPHNASSSPCSCLRVLDPHHSGDLARHGRHDQS
jgi:hypothetical protein